MTTEKDAQILAQSQMQRAIEMVELIGFPENLQNASQREKVTYICDKLTPYLMNKVAENAAKFMND